MKDVIVGMLMKFVSIDLVSKTMALCVVKTLEYARKKGGKSWDESKKILANAENWIHLFNCVYDDNELTPEEEQKIQEAIKEMTVTKKITTILKQ